MRRDPLQRAPSLQIHSVDKGPALWKATEDHSENHGLCPGSADEVAFNAALAVIDGVRPKDEIEAMLAAHMAVTNVALLELVARTRGAIAGHIYQGSGIKRLDVLGNLTTKFMRTYPLALEFRAPDKVMKYPYLQASISNAAPVIFTSVFNRPLMIDISPTGNVAP